MLSTLNLGWGSHSSLILQIRICSCREVNSTIYEYFIAIHKLSIPFLLTPENRERNVEKRKIIHSSFLLHHTNSNTEWMICSKVDSDWLLLVGDAAKCICKEKGIQKCPSVWSQSIPFFILKYIFIITFELIIIIHYAEGEFDMKRGRDGTIVQISIPWFFTFSSFYSIVVYLYAAGWLFCCRRLHRIRCPRPYTQSSPSNNDMWTLWWPLTQPLALAAAETEQTGECFLASTLFILITMSIFS